MKIHPTNLLNYRLERHICI